MNRDEARDYFKPLTYNDLTKKNFNKLVAILEEHLGKWNRQVLDERNNNINSSKYYMNIHKHKKYGKYPGTRYNPERKDGLLTAFIYVKCDDYSVREAISFNSDGWIGFAGWADNTNVQPFINAFMEWVNLLKFNTQTLELPQLNLGTFKYIGDYQVLPESAEMYDVATSKGKTFIYIDTWQYQPNPEETKLQKILEIVNNSQDCSLKQELLEIL